MSLAFTLIGAVIFAMIKGHAAKIPQEAFIGISYAVASAAVILTLSKATGEAEHLQRHARRQHPVCAVVEVG